MSDGGCDLDFDSFGVIQRPFDVDVLLAGEPTSKRKFVAVARAAGKLRETEDITLSDDEGERPPTRKDSTTPAATSDSDLTECEEGDESTQCPPPKKTAILGPTGGVKVVGIGRRPSTYTAPRVPKAARGEVPANQQRLTALFSVSNKVDPMSSKGVPHPAKLKYPRFLAFAACAHDPNLPPSTAFKTWPEYIDYVTHLEYLSDAWMEEHEKFMSASSIGKALGMDPNETPEKYWSRCRGYKEPVTWFSEYMQIRGLHLEDFVRSLYGMFCGKGAVRLAESHSFICPHAKWLMATPDIDIFDATTDQLIRRGEIKCPLKRDAFHTVPPEHMAQVQFAMWSSGTTTTDYMSLKLIDDTLDSTFIVHRVHFSKEYIERALPILQLFCRSVLNGTSPPRRGIFVPPKVQTEQILHMEQVVGMIHNGASIVVQAIQEAKSKAHCAVAKNAASKLMPAVIQQQPDTIPSFDGLDL